MISLLTTLALASPEIADSDTAITVGVGMAPPFSRLLHEHVAVQHRFSEGFGAYGIVETYSGHSIRPGLQARGFLPVSENFRLVGGAGASVWFNLMSGEQSYQAFMPELDLGIQGETGPVHMALDLTPTLALREEVELWPMVRLSIGGAF